MARINDFVKNEFQAFLTSRLPEQALDVVDDIVLDYLISVLQSLTEDDSTDIDDFIDMMNAYVPGFNDLRSDMVYSWLVELATKLQNKKDQKTYNNSTPRTEITTTSLPTYPPHSSNDYSKYHSNEKISSSPINIGSTVLPSSPDGIIWKGGSPSTKGESTSHSWVNSDDELQPEDEKIPQNFCIAVESLCELFPMATKLEIRRCLLIANGDADEAARLMLMSRDNGESGDPLVDSNPKPHHPSSKRQDINEDDQDKIKTTLVSRYGFVDVNSDSKTYQPSLLNKEEKKMIRYRDNLIVSTKGERFSAIKKQENEDEKKTYVNLKPARKYRFH